MQYSNDKLNNKKLNMKQDVFYKSNMDKVLNVFISELCIWLCILISIIDIIE